MVLKEQRRASYGKRDTRSFFSGNLKEERGTSRSLLRVEEKIIPLAFRRRKPPIYSISLWKRLILSRYNSLGVISIR